MEKFLNKIVKYWAIITASYIIIGLIRLSLYYSLFDINITSYIDLQEIFTVWMPDSIGTLLMLSMPLILIWFVRNVQPADDRYYHYFNIVPKLLLLLTIVGYYLRYWVNVNHISKDRLDIIEHSLNCLFTGIITIIAVPQLAICLNEDYKTFKIIKKGIKKTYSKTNSYLSVMTIMFIVFMMSTIEVDSYAITTQGDDVTVFKNKDVTIQTDNNLIYIGKTKNYIMFYNKLKHQSSIFPMQDLIELSFGGSKTDTFKNMQPVIKTTKEK